MSSLIIDPEYAKLLEEYIQLKAQLAEVFEQRADLVYHEANRWQTEYMLKIGVLEYDLYEVECSIARTRRKIELVQSCINRQVAINLAAIERQLDREYEQYRERLKQLAAEIDLANYLKKCPKLRPQEVAELKRIYRLLVKELHPDLNPHRGEEQRALWHQVNAAYRTGNVDMLRVLLELVLQGGSSNNGRPSAMEELTEKIQFLRKKIGDLLLEMEQIRQTFPFDQVELLKSPLLVARRQAELREAIQRGQEMLEELQQYLTTLVLNTNTHLN